MSRPLFHTAHYNIIAARIKEQMIHELVELDTSREAILVRSVGRISTLAATSALTLLALRFAKQFQEENPAFDPLKFLDACSPNADILPLSELWET